MRAPKTGQPSKPFESVSPDERGYEPQENVDPQSFAQDERRIRVESHEHNGLDAPKVNVKNLEGLFSVVDAVPVEVPRNAYEQIKIYSNGGTRRLYIYVTDSAGSGAWRYAALT